MKEKYNYEIIFVNDGSEDDSIKILENLAEKDEKIKVIQFSRNFGKEAEKQLPELQMVRLCETLLYTTGVDVCAQ